MNNPTALSKIPKSVTEDRSEYMGLSSGLITVAVTTLQMWCIPSLAGDDISRVKYYCLKWFCGVDLLEKKTHLSPEERHDLQLWATNIGEDPFWKKVVDINGLICCACCFFLHGFWA